MPSRRSKSKDRERKRKARLKKTDEEKEADREKARTGMAEFRDKRVTPDQRKLRHIKVNQRMDDIRDRRSEEEIDTDKEGSKIKMRKSRKSQDEEIKGYQKIENKHKKRLAREKDSKEEHLENNLKSIEGDGLGGKICHEKYDQSALHF